ncbi:MAG: CNNM domain-containing protein [Bacilli bacterium]
MMVVVIVCLLIVLAFCSIFEASFSSLNIIRIKKMMESKNNNAKIVYNLYQNYSEVITTILVINCIASVAVSSLTVYYFSNLYGDECIGIVTIILTVIILIFTEIIPKILGREYSENFALKLSFILSFLVKLFTPINKIISKFEKKVKNNHKVTATTDELVEIVKTIKEEGVIEEKESAFIQKAVLLKKLKVQNVMVNKDDVSYLYDTDSSLKVKKCIFRDNHDRIPIITKDNKVVGILYEVDLLDEILDNGTISIKKSMKEPICISRSTNLASCLELLHSARAHMALVTDRYNNFLGIVTVEDIINELMKS